MVEGFGQWLLTFFVWVVAYLIGSIPFGVLIAKRLGEDLTTQGSGNVGATNALRVLGPKWGAVVCAADVLKGCFAVWLACTWTGAWDFSRALAALAVVSGHVWSVFLGFKGGKGVATMLGAVAVLSWQAALIAVFVWICVVLATRYVSLASLAGVVAGTCYFGIAQGSPSWYAVWATLMIVFVLYTHRENWQRLLSGTESRFSLKAS